MENIEKQMTNNFCSQCGGKIDENTLFCAECGAKVGQENLSEQNSDSSELNNSNSSSIWMIILVVMVFAIGFGIFGYKYYSSHHEGYAIDDTVVSLDEKPSFDEYKSISFGFDYRKAMLGKIPNESKLVFSGKINQIISDNEAKAFTKQEQLFNETIYSGDDVYIVFDSKPEILEGDVVTIYGRYGGVEAYETVLHTQVTIPKIIVDYYSVNGTIYGATEANATDEETNQNIEQPIETQSNDTTGSGGTDTTDNINPENAENLSYLKYSAYVLMTGVGHSAEDTSHPEDTIKITKDAYGKTIFCLDDMSICRTYEEVFDTYQELLNSGGD